MILNEDHQLYKGVFWIIDSDNLENNKNYCFTIPSDQYGNVDSTDLDLNAKSGTTYNHEKLWKSLPRLFTQGKQYNYFPRGRVEIQTDLNIINAILIIKNLWCYEALNPDGDLERKSRKHKGQL